MTVAVGSATLSRARPRDGRSCGYGGHREKCRSRPIPVLAICILIARNCNAGWLRFDSVCDISFVPPAQRETSYYAGHPVGLTRTRSLSGKSWGGSQTARGGASGFPVSNANLKLSAVPSPSDPAPTPKFNALGTIESLLEGIATFVSALLWSLFVLPLLFFTRNAFEQLEARLAKE